MVSRDDMLRLNKRIRDNEKLIADAYTTILAETKLAAFPVGAIYESTNSTSPATLFGGVWEAYGGGRVLVGVWPSDPDFNAAGKYGGHKDMQQHTHTQNSHNHTQNGHSHTALTWSDSSATPITLADGSGRTNFRLAFSHGEGRTDDIRTASTTATNQAATATNQNAGTGNSGNMPPYIVVHRWRRTA